MRILGLTLKNYIGIYAGMGLHEITIDFSKCTHQICIIKGDNGSGKSTILKALSPINDSSRDYLDGYDAEKYIVYALDNGSVMEIHYISPWKGDKRGTTSLHVFINNENGRIDVNPNGNLGEGKSIICDNLGIDDDFLLLAQLSSDDRGLADKMPSERKKFINSKISQLDFYNVLYKKLTKKSLELKGLISSINAKISDLGNVEQIKSNISSLENSMGDMEDRKNLLISSIAREQEKIKFFEKDGVPLDVANAQAKANLLELSNQKKDLESIIEEYDNIKKIKIQDVELKLKELELDIKAKEIKIEELDKKSTSLSKSIDINKIKRMKYTDIEDAQYAFDMKKTLEEEIEHYKTIFITMNFSAYEDITEEDYKRALKSIEYATNQIYLIRDEFNFTVREAMLNAEVYSNIMEGGNQNLIEEARANIEKNKDLIKEQEILKQKAVNYGLIPEDCSHYSDCPFIKDIVEAKNCILSEKDYETLIKNIDILEEEIVKYEDASALKMSLIRCESEFRNLFSMLADNSLRKFPGMEWINSRESIIEFVNSGKFIELNTRDYLEKSNLITLLKMKRENLNAVNNNINKYNDNKDLIDTLDEIIQKDSEEYREIRETVSNLRESIETTKLNISTLEDVKEQIKTLEEYLEQYEEIDTKEKELKKMVKSMETDMVTMTRLQEKVQRMLSELRLLNIDRIPKIQDDLQRSKYKMVLYNDYIEEFNKYKKEADWVEKLKYYSSPTTGIQTIYMEMFMNDILVTANKLLQSFFGGEFVLQPFVINEKEFRMPCLGNAILNDDISSMSTAQICMISMILSFALLRSTSNDYSIIKLDEIDGGLDSNNRLNFVTVLSQLMNMLHYEQCIMISHNSEIAMYNADVIVLKCSDSDLKLDGANIIWRFIV